MSDDPITRLNAALEDRYLIEGELGEGGMATVYLAEDVRHHRKVAVKVLKPELAAVVGGERFLAEIETTARLQHPNILPLFDSGEADSFLFYVMPYVDGESLRERIEREKQLPVDEAVRIATEVAEALQSAHERGVVHRDIKPANIMLIGGRPLVADFGIALALSSAGGHRLTETGLSIGTPHYMSPEQATGDQVVGPASDVYSLGCVLYEMLVGEPPYTGSTAQAILGRVITSDAESVMSQRRAVPAHVDAVVANALEKLPADRFGSAAEFVSALKNEGFRYGVVAGGISVTGLPSWVRALVITGWGLAAVLATILLVSASDEPPAPMVRRLSLATLEGYGPSEWLELTPDGSALIMADGPRGGPGHELVIHRLDDRVRTPIPGSQNAFDPAVSPDGQYVAFGSLNGLYLAPVAGGTTRTLVSDRVACCVRWGADGYVYYTDDVGDAWRVRDSGGEPESLVRESGGQGISYYHPLEEDRVILSVGDPGTLEILDVASGRRELLTEGTRPFVTEDGYLVFARGERGIFAAALDAGAMRLEGPPVLLIEGVETFGAAVDEAAFTLSESGDLVYWTGAAGAEVTRELVWVDRAGEATSVDMTWMRDFESVELSPNGARAAVTIGSVGDTEIWLKGLDEGPEQRLTSYQGMNRRPVWSPDGATLAFISDRAGPRAVYSVPADGIGTPELLAEHPGEEVDEVLWSPDGDWLVYRTGTTAAARDIYARRLRPDTVTISVSAREDIDERSPALSPNGRWLAYVSNETGQDEVWVRPFPDVTRGSRQVSVDGGIEPVWSNDGRELFFRDPGLASVAVGEGLEFSTGEMRILFSAREFFAFSSHRAYDYEADRERFLMIRDVMREASEAELILVENFIEEVRARVGN